MRPKAVICGSYHRDPAGLKRLFHELEATGCRILSPISVAFDDTSHPIVRLRSETDFTIQELEKFHLRAIVEADLIWLHNPSGYVGLSAAYELGFAQALRKPVYAFEKPADEMLASQVTIVHSVFAALDSSNPATISEWNPA